MNLDELQKACEKILEVEPEYNVPLDKIYITPPLAKIFLKFIALTKAAKNFRRFTEAKTHWREGDFTDEIDSALKAVEKQL